jgi:AcrR family transcriptional regulator
MKKPEDAYHHGDLRNSLVEEAVRLIEREGLDAFSLREVARRVGVSANAAYRHFEDKDALLAAVAARGLGVLARRMREAIEGVTTRGAGPRAIAHLRATGRAYVAFALAKPELFRVTFARGAITPDHEHCENGEQSPYVLLSGCLDAMVAAGVLAPAPEAGRGAQGVDRRARLRVAGARGRSAREPRAPRGRARLRRRRHRGCAVARGPLSAPARRITRGPGLRRSGRGDHSTCCVQTMSMQSSTSPAQQSALVVHDSPSMRHSRSVEHMPSVPPGGMRQ